MNRFFSYWLTFSEEDAAYLSEIIQELSFAYNAPPFIPHLTVYGQVYLGKDEGIKIAGLVAKNNGKIVIKKTRVSWSDHFFKTIFIEYAENKQVENMSSAISDKLFEHAPYTLLPHTSLIYQHLTHFQKEEIVKKINIKDEYVLNGLALVDLGGREDDIYDVKMWNIVHSQDL